MAELPEIGKHCYLESCKKLDFTPFHCRLCSHFYCTQHRFEHGCNASRVYDPSLASTSAPLRPFLCSHRNCFAGESIKVVCPFCARNYCLQHRHPTEHACEHIPDADDKTQDPEIRERLRKMHEALDPIVKEEREAAGQQGAPEVKTEKPPLSAEEQARIDRINAMRSKLGGKACPVPLAEPTSTSAKISENSTSSQEPETVPPKIAAPLAPITPQQEKEDRIAVMKLKMTNKPSAGADRQILFVEWSGGRKPVFVHKSWTIGKALSSAKDYLKLDFGIQSACRRGFVEPLNVADNVGQILKEEDSIVLIPE